MLCRTVAQPARPTRCGRLGLAGGQGLVGEAVRAPWGRARQQPDKVAVAGAHPSGESTARGGEGSFSIDAPAMGSSSSGDKGGDDVLEHQEANRGGG
jgi:hypothetical protein